MVIWLTPSTVHVVYECPQKLKPSTQFTAQDPKRSRFFCNKNRNIFRILLATNIKNYDFFWGRFSCLVLQQIFEGGGNKMHKMSLKFRFLLILIILEQSTWTPEARTKILETLSYRCTLVEAIFNML